MKFGGTSVGSGQAFVRAAGTVAAEASTRPTAVVVSAMSGVTDTLLAAAQATLGATDRTKTGATLEGSLAELHRSLYDRHLQAAREAVGSELLPGVEAGICALLASLTGSLTGGLHACEEARTAEIVVHGERLSACILSAAIASRGIPAEVAEDPIATDSAFEEAEVEVEKTRVRCTSNVRSVLERGSVAVVAGFVGRDGEGRCTTLGRGGSDLSATVIGRGIGAAEVWILTDVSGVLDADPRLVGDAATLPVMSYREAHLFAGMGAKVLHHRTMEPAAAANLAVYVKNSFEPQKAGTLISSRECGAGVRSVALRRGLSLRRSDVPGEAFCVLGCGGDGVLSLVEAGEKSAGEVAAIVGIGSPTDRDLLSGLRSLLEAGIGHRWVGNTSSGVAFVVDAGDATDALRVLHASLLGRGAKIEVSA
ncbi:aspartate kinase [Rubrobacter indicoceani]|uniref:aspartate kinase n=1 Tax=Rubrobacter indicoceani TaxID=2051957 RepID=UPI000E5A76CC|nr:aspartate kinase [Rubrobacter indicoceani]